MKKKQLGHKYTQRKGRVKILREDSIARERNPQKSPTLPAP